MPESGGPTTQSGILYQNSIAALYLGRLLDLRPTTNGHPVISVRVEAPEEIDDIVVLFTNQSRLLIQAKESLSLSGDPWNKFWSALSVQLNKPDSKFDNCRLVIGQFNHGLDHLREACDRSRGKDNASEWWDSLNQQHKSLIESIKTLLSQDVAHVFFLVSRLTVEFLPFERIDSVCVRDWMPLSSVADPNLFSLLRDSCGGSARIRATFVANTLSEQLWSKFGVRLLGRPGDGLQEYLHSLLSQLDHIGVPGTSLAATEAELFVWPSFETISRGFEADFDDEDPWSRRHYRTEDFAELKDFPNDNIRILLEAAAGFGKTTILRAVTRRLATDTSYVPAFMLAEDLRSCGSIDNYLDHDLNRRYRTSIDWHALGQQGRAVILVDGLDELDDAARTNTLILIERYAARFPATPMLISARDGSTVGISSTFKLLRARPLDDDQSFNMIKRYSQVREGLDARKIADQIFRHEGLEQLCRIPLFLSLLIATLHTSNKIPKSRSELLERYVTFALTPERHKLVAQGPLPPTTLRKGAETIALMALEANSAAINEWDVRNRLSAVHGTGVGDKCVEVLVQYGLIRRAGTRLSFAIATIQEYLAGSALASSENPDVKSWFRNIARRPWAQALQFAIEKIPEVEPYLTSALSFQDDYFHTTLRLVARCIVNGAAVSEDLKGRVSTELAKAWISGTSESTWSVGNLIADGFCRPVSQELRRAIRLDVVFGRGMILSRAHDADLTLECLSIILAESHIGELSQRAWLEALRPVAAEAVKLLLTRAYQERKSSLSACVIAGILCDLHEVSEIKWNEIKDDERLPLVVRAAAIFGDGVRSCEEDHDLLERAVSEADDPGVWSGFHRAFLTLPWWGKHIARLCEMDALDGPASINKYVEAALCESPEADCFKSDMRSLSCDPKTIGCNKFVLNLFLGTIGYTSHAEAATNNLAEASEVEMSLWIREIPYFSEETSSQGVEALMRRTLPINQEVNIIDNLSRISQWQPFGKRKSFLSSGPFRALQTSSAVGRSTEKWANQLLSSGSLTEAQREKLTFAKADLGSKIALRELISLLEQRVRACDTITDNMWNSLARVCNLADKYDYDINIDVLWQIIEKAPNHPTYSMVDQIILVLGEESYPRLFKMFGERKYGSIRYALIRHFERIAPRDGLFVRVIDRELHVSKVEDTCKTND
jgi:hypothetical protein